MKKKISMIVMLMLVVLLLCSCTEAGKVRHNVSKEADNFNVMRRVAVLNTVSGEPVFEIIGRMSIVADTNDDQLEIIVEVDDGIYKKHVIGLNDATTMYVVEDIDGADVNPYKYEINYLPESIIPFTFTMSR